MRFATLGGLYQKPATVSKLYSGVKWSTQPVDIPTGALYVEADPAWGGENVFMFVRISGTCTVGDLLYPTGASIQYVENSQTGVKPWGVSLVAPTASGDWTFMQVYGRNTTIQITNTFGDTDISASLFGGNGSACWNMSQYLTNLADNITNMSVHSATLFYVGRSFSDNTTSAVVGFIDLM